MIDTDFLRLSYLSSQVLGDGTVRNDKRIDIRHSSKTRDYVEVKRDLAIQLGLHVGEITEHTWLGSLGEHSVCAFSISRIEQSPLNALAETLVEQLDPMGLLLWWLDDGCLVVHEKKDGTSVSRFGYLGTEAFDQLTNQRLAQVLRAKFGLETTVHIDRGGIVSPDATYYRLYFSATSMRAFIDLVRPWLHLVPESLRYKLNMDYRPNRLSTSAEYARLYNF